MDRLPGFRDFLPAPVAQKDLWEFEARDYLFSKWRRVASAYGFREYDGPPLEPLELLTKKSGEEIVGQLYHFEDKGNRKVALRPEMTPTLARMIAANERQYKKPIKWFSIPQLFRYERKQKGRLREHFQLNADIVGETGEGADAELIALLIDVLRSVGLTAEDFVIRLSSREAWQQYLASHPEFRGDDYGFFQVVDKLERMPEEVADARLREFGLSLASIQEFIGAGTPTPALQQVLDNLGARGLDAFVKVDYGIIRGLAYYTGIVFEAFDRRGEFRAIAGGGRYDQLIQLVSDGKTDLPALGFGMGDVVLLELLRSRQLLPEWDSRLDVYCLLEDQNRQADLLGLLQWLRDQGIRADASLTSIKPNKQFGQAADLGARFVATPQGEGGLVRLKDLHLRDEQVLSRDDLLAELRRRLKES